MRPRLHVGHSLLAANGARLSAAEADEIRGEAQGFSQALSRQPEPKALLEAESPAYQKGWHTGWERGLALVVGR